jgi:hypothetical protein
MINHCDRRITHIGDTDTVRSETNQYQENENHLSYLFEHKKGRHNDVGNPCSGLECVQNVQIFRQCSDTSDLLDNVQNFQSIFRILAGSGIHHLNFSGIGN